MKLRKQTILVMLFGLLLLAFAAVVAQTPAQGDQKKAESCCCSGDSCQMKTDDTAAKSDCCKGDSCTMKKKEMNHTDGHECCGCCADSCDMKDMKDMKHDMKDHKAGCCKAKAKDAKDKNNQ